MDLVRGEVRGDSAEAVLVLDQVVTVCARNAEQWCYINDDSHAP